MKSSFFKRIGLLSLVLATTSVGLAACKSNVKVPVTFVASDSSSGYNCAVTIGNYSYKFKGSLDSKSKKFTLKGTVQGRASASSGGNQGGPGFPGGGGFGGGDWGGPGGQGGAGGPGGQGGETAPTVPVTGITLSLDKEKAFIGEKVTATATITPDNATTKDVEWSVSDDKIATVSSGTITPLAAGEVTITATSKDNPSIKASAKLTVEVENLAAHDFTVSGTYSLDKGYGYVLNFADTANSVIHTDYNKTEARHEFYYNVKTVDGAESFVKFQAKDITFKSTLAKDYKKWDVRDSRFVFTAKATGNNNSLAYAYLYLHNDGSVVEDKPSGVNRVISMGATWKEENGTIVVTNGQTQSVADKSINPDRPAYKLSYDSYAFICSTNPDVKWKKLTESDFDGETTHEFLGSYTKTGPDGGEVAVRLNLGKDGKAYMYEAGSLSASKKGTWVAQGDEVKVNLGEGQDAMELVSSTSNGVTTVVFQITVSSFFGSSTVDVVLTKTK